jgi:hypothetical protein
MQEYPIEDELDRIDLFDTRLNKRSQKILSKLYEGIGKSLPGALQSKNEIEAAYNFFQNGWINSDRILAPHREKTIERIKKHDFVIFIQDSSDINLSHMEEVKQIGVLNETKKPGCNFHTMIACTRERLMLGVIDHQFMVREKEDLGKLASNNSRPIEDKESFRWLEFYRQAEEIARGASNTKCICVADRESDIIELFLEAKDSPLNLVVRSKHDRNIESEEGLKKKLNEVIATAPIIGQSEFTLTPRKKKIALGKAIRDKIREKDRIVKKKKRLVKQNIRVASITVQAPKHKKHLGKVNLQVVYLEEIDPVKGEDPISWVLLTTLPVNTVEEAQEVIQIYLARWSIEVFFHVLKTGCKIESLQFKQGASVFACIALYLIVAWRVMYVMFLGRNCPDLPCTMIFDDDEWKSAYAAVKQCKPPPDPPKLGEFIIILATLGGYLKRQGSTNPGPKIMWQALQMLAGCAIGWRACKEFGV